MVVSYVYRGVSLTDVEDVVFAIVRDGGGLPVVQAPVVELPSVPVWDSEEDARRSWVAERLRGYTVTRFPVGQLLDLLDGAEEVDAVVIGWVNPTVVERVRSMALTGRAAVKLSAVSGVSLEERAQAH